MTRLNVVCRALLRPVSCPLMQTLVLVCICDVLDLVRRANVPVRCLVLSWTALVVIRCLVLVCVWLMACVVLDRFRVSTRLILIRARDSSVVVLPLAWDKAVLVLLRVVVTCDLVLWVVLLSILLWLVRTAVVLCRDVGTSVCIVLSNLKVTA